MAALAGCCERGSIDYGVETGSVRVAALNNRRLDPDLAVSRILDAVSAGLEPYTWWMVGLPGEDLDAVHESEQLIERTMEAGGIPRWVSPLILFPQTEIHKNPKRFGIQRRFTSFSDYAVFSDITLAEAVMFSDAIAHESDDASRDEITARALRLRGFIVDKLPLLRKAYAGSARRLDLIDVEARIRQSFL